MGRILWLDSLRGIASALVVIHHSKSSEPKSIVGFLTRSYWDEPAEENHRLIQLPPFRLLFNGPSMVALFMVISGYAISLPLLRCREDVGASNVGFFRRLCSAATRRIFRIYLPSIAILFLSQLVYFCNVFPWKAADDWLGGLKPLTAPWAHVQYVLSRIVHLLDISNHQVDINFDRNRPDMRTINYQLWTMPIEFRGSCAVYLLILTFSFWKPQPRYLALVGVAMYWFYMGHWDLFAFVAGILLAERHVASESGPDREIALSYSSSPLEIQEPITKAWNKLTEKIYLQRIGISVSFILGMYFLCMCGADRLAAEYRWLAVARSPEWDNAEMMPRCWRSVGAVLVIYAISKSALLQRPLNSRPLQYLGKISFPLYLVHPTVYLALKWPVRDFLWWAVTRTPYPGTIEASKHALSFAMTWMGTMIVLGAVMVVASELWNRFVDMKCLVLARRFEKCVSC
ncbi:Acyltransferase 3 [Penicillium roqueforti FM164]|uniref:Acyltransferase 3 n=1 Tax=Penicillium roqueforti (strain FM164) TaxID=1365484 RepID=W6Q4V2_PENRF|nr:Acyltransferase 3 [Penicillium roqueforti FM164]